MYVWVVIWQLQEDLMFYKTTFRTVLCLLLLTITSCSVPETITSKGAAGYKTTEKDADRRGELLQNARIFSTGNAAAGMVLLFTEKECTAIHEFGPAWKRGALKEDHLDFFRDRLAARIRKVLVTMENNKLDTINGAADLAKLLESVESAKTMDELAELGEKIHACNDTIRDSLEKL